jgi:16S rRNA (uracil1498-N3)-methyltransferase
VLRLPASAPNASAHWQAIAEAACEQCGRAVVPVVAPVWLPVHLAARAAAAARTGPRLLLSLRRRRCRGPPWQRLCSAAGGGHTAAHAQRPRRRPHARRRGRCAGRRLHLPTDLGPRVLRAETAPLAVLAWLALQVTLHRRP